MPPSEIRKEAREALSGKWGKGVCIILAYMLITFVIGFFEGLFEGNPAIFLIIELAFIVITMPLSFGLIISFMKLKRGEDVKAFGFLKDGFSNFGKSWGIWFHTFIRMLLPVICFVLILVLMTAMSIYNSASAIMSDTVSTSFNSLLHLIFVILEIASVIYIVSRSLLYALAYNIGYDNPDFSSKECVVKSAKLMKGNRGNLFLLELSFIGWALLVPFTLGIGMLWLMPYMQVALVCFYERVIGKTAVNPIKTEE